MGTTGNLTLAYAGIVNFRCDASAATKVCVGRMKIRPFLFPPMQSEPAAPGQGKLKASLHFLSAKSAHENVRT
jgi:hypothetical protein